MDRFIDEQDSTRDRSSSPNFYSLMFGNSDNRKGLSLYPGAKSQLSTGGDNNGVTAGELSNRESMTSNSTSTVTGVPTVTEAANAQLRETSSPNGRLQVPVEKTQEHPS